MKKFSMIQEDLRKWFDKDHPEGGWKRINSKGEAIGPCAREPGEPKPKCMSNEKRAQLSKKERASAVAAKRKHDPNAERKGEPINVSNFGKGKISEDMENLEEKNVPTSPEKWAQAKAQAKAKFDVYPSAYANGWAAKKYKEMGGGWKSVSEAVKDKFDIGEYDQEGDMAKSDLRSIIANAQKMHDMLEDADNLPEWVQSKITKAEDYISTVANYMTSEMSEEAQMNESGGPVVYKKGDDHIEKYGEDSFALYKDGKKSKYYTSIDAAKEAMKEDVEQLDELMGKGQLPKIAAYHKQKGDEAKGKMETIRNTNRQVPVPKEKSAKIYAKDAESTYHYTQAKRAKALMAKEEIEQVEEGMMKRMATDAEEDKRLGSWRKETPWMKVKKTVTDKSGAKHTAMSRAKDLAKQAAKKTAGIKENTESLDESRQLEIVREAMKTAKKKKETTASEDKFQSEPELASPIVKA